MIEPHGMITRGRWKGTRGAKIADLPNGNVLIRPFNDTAFLEDARIHLSPDNPILLGRECWQTDDCSK
jgi:hypothetical protein